MLSEYKLITEVTNTIKKGYSTKNTYNNIKLIIFGNTNGHSITAIIMMYITSIVLLHKYNSFLLRGSNNATNLTIISGYTTAIK